jgi:thioredoxin/glutathione reductase (selenoprotein)
MEVEFDYDLMVIGGGSGGLAAAKQAASNGAKVALCDFVKPSSAGTKWGLGGTCVNVGCIPKKLMHFASLSGEALHDAAEAGWGVDVKAAHNWEKMINNVNNHIRSLNWGYKVALMEKEVIYYNKLASFVDSHKVKLVDAQGGEEFVTAKHFIIAVGGRPNSLDLPGFQEHSITSDDLFWKKTAPGKTLVIGAGYIAMECGGFIQSMGHQVTMLVRSTPLKEFDQDMIKRVTLTMENMGTKFVTGYDSSKGSIVKDEATGKLTVTYLANGVDVVEEFDTVLVAIGRSSDTKALGLDAAGVSYTKWNKITTDAANKTNVEHIWAIGDAVEGNPELTPVAIREGLLLADRLYAKSERLFNYDMISTTIFTPLEYSKCGMSEEEAEKRYGADNIEMYHTAFKPLEWNFLKTRQNSICYCKAVCLMKEDMRVVGLHYVGPNAGEVMQGYAVGMLKGMTIKDLQDTVGIHPTCSEEITDLKITKRQQKEVVKTGC